MAKQSRITKAAKDQPCIKCGVDDGTVCARHYNGVYQNQYGKGRGIKCHDLASAELCNDCERPFSEGQIDGFQGSADRSSQFLHWCMLTNIRRYKRGVITDGSKQAKPVPASSKILGRHNINGVYTL